MIKWKLLIAFSVCNKDMSLMFTYKPKGLDHMANYLKWIKEDNLKILQLLKKISMLKQLSLNENNEDDTRRTIFYKVQILVPKFI